MFFLQEVGADLEMISPFIHNSQEPCALCCVYSPCLMLWSEHQQIIGPQGKNYWSHVWLALMPFSQEPWPSNAREVRFGKLPPIPGTTLPMAPLDYFHQMHCKQLKKVACHHILVNNSECDNCWPCQHCLWSVNIKKEPFFPPDGVYPRRKMWSDLLPTSIHYLISILVYWLLILEQ